MSFVQDVGLNLWKQSKMTPEKSIKLRVEIHMLEVFYIALSQSIPTIKYWPKTGRPYINV
jgi:3-polyprenyl-4-hydroxybenzoate decarboxylase